VEGQYFRNPLKRASDDVRQVDKFAVRRYRARFQTGHVQKIADEPVQTLRFVLDGADQLVLRRIVHILAIGPKTRGRSQNRCQGCSKIVRNRRQQGASQLFGFGGKAGRFDIRRKIDPFDGEGGLIGQRIQQAALIGREQRPGPVIVEPNHGHRAPAGVHGQKQPLGAGQGIGAPARGAVVLPAPFGRGEIGIAQHVLGRIA
jgi:hypothetical protein